MLNRHDAITVLSRMQHVRFHKYAAAPLLHARLKQVPIALFGHPVRAREVTVVDALGALGFLLGIESENDGDSFAPVGAFSFGIEQTDIGYQMPLIIRTDAVQLGRVVFEGRYRHDFSRVLIDYRRSNPSLTAIPGLVVDAEMASRRR